VAIGYRVRRFALVVTAASRSVPARSHARHAKNLQSRPFGSNIRQRSSLGRTVATQWLDFCFEESPGSMDTLPGNAWAPLIR
jgi:hypothetical protein